MEFDFLRVILSFYVGYFLMVSGSLSQIVTNNKLASPSTLGFDGFAVLTILIAQFGISFFQINISLEVSSFIIFIIVFTFVCIKVLNKYKESQRVTVQNSMQKIILIGIGFNLLVGAIFSIIQFLFMAMNMDFPSGLWFGNFRFVSAQTSSFFLLVFFGTNFILYKLSKSLRIIAIGNDFAQGLGINVLSVQRKSLLVSLFLTGLVISFFGVFSFLGLIFPHIIRIIPFFKYNIKNELHYGPYLAGAFLSGLDLACYNFTVAGAELPVGMVCSVIGSFLLLLLLFKKNQSH
jgi:iron complex transport system permease protein